MLQLDPLNLELNCRHLIEASAGTGKTFNITRLYARLILEKKLSVQEILVMTYTRAATEEIKGRVAAFLLEIHNEWRADTPSEFTQTLVDRVGLEEGDALLTSALLSLDEASIFTIHGFCQRVLKQFAVSLNADLDLELVTDSTELMMQGVQDYLRVATKNEESFTLLASKNWHIPDNFFNEFRSAISSDLALTQVTMAQVQLDESANLARQLHEQATIIQTLFTELQENQTLLFDACVFGHKEEAKRTQEWHVLIGWFEQVLTYLQLSEVKHRVPNTSNEAGQQATGPAESAHVDLLELLTMPKEVGDFINGNRFRSSPEAKAILEPLKLLRVDIKSWIEQSTKQLEKNAQLTAVLAVVKQGIYSIRERVEEAKKKAHVVLFDDLISVFSNALQSQGTNLLDSIRKQFPVALVDEFQDTDRHQYQILDLLYPKADKNSLLLMIGDPKQAIYGFRGGDIFVYLAAKQDADHVWLMDTNWRSSAQMVTGYNRLFWGHSLQQEHARSVFGFDIDYEVIKSTPRSKAADSPLFDPLVSRTAMTYMLATDGIETSSGNDNTKRKKVELEQQILDWSSLEIMRLLGDAKIGDSKVVPADIAVLVKDRIEATLVKSSLDAVGLTSVYLSDKTALFSTSQATELYRVLDAILHSTNRSTLVAGANSSLLNRVITISTSTSEHQKVMAELHADLMHPEWEKLVVACFELKEKWAQQGIFSLLLSLIKEKYAPQTSAERSLTNMMHLAEAMAKNAVLNKLPEQQLAWLSHQIFDHVADEEVQLRLESDANLIKIVTQHGSKGLEYPIVFVPFGNKYKDPRKRKTSTIQHFKYHDMQSAQSIYQLGATHSSLDEYAKQDHAEKIRLMYVAVTRAEHRCYLGFVNDISNSESALNSALGIPKETLNECKSEDPAHTKVEEWMNTHVFEPNHGSSVDGTLNCNSSAVNVDITPVMSSTYKGLAKVVIPPFVDATLAKRSAWIISSFSNLSRFHKNENNGYYDVASPNQISLHAIETAGEHKVISADFASDGISEQAFETANTNPFAIRYQLEKGADTGNLLHDILEQVDFHSPDWDSAAVVALSKYKALDDNEVTAVFEWLESCLKTPLIGNFCLADLEVKQTLREAEFYFPMPHLKVRHVAKLLQQYRQHLQKNKDWSALSISMADIPELSGMMHGFIDLIFEHDGKYYVADYKSTHLGDSPKDYNTEKLHENNQHHLYDLQYLLYSLALHKYLKQQLSDYSFNIHFGGVFYLYLRGMSPESQIAGEFSGVFFDKVDPHYIDLLEELFSQTKKEV
ncbi:MAG: exodeoxyribonuclease V beta subunit [Glaciecola sp.]|jgi:exodeoxyribonuclease V beta subunit